MTCVHNAINNNGNQNQKKQNTKHKISTAQTDRELSYYGNEQKEI